MANVQLQAWGDERDAFGGIVPETEDGTVDKTVLCLYDEAADQSRLKRAFDRIILKMEKGPLAAETE